MKISRCALSRLFNNYTYGMTGIFDDEPDFVNKL